MRSIVELLWKALYRASAFLFTYPLTTIAGVTTGLIVWYVNPVRHIVLPALEDNSFTFGVAIAFGLVAIYLLVPPQRRSNRQARNPNRPAERKRARAGRATGRDQIIAALHYAKDEYPWLPRSYIHRIIITYRTVSKGMNAISAGMDSLFAWIWNIRFRRRIGIAAIGLGTGLLIAYMVSATRDWTWLGTFSLGIVVTGVWLVSIRRKDRMQAGLPLGFVRNMVGSALLLLWFSFAGGEICWWLADHGDMSLRKYCVVSAFEVLFFWFLIARVTDAWQNHDWDQPVRLLAVVGFFCSVALLRPIRVAESIVTPSQSEATSSENAWNLWITAAEKRLQKMPKDAPVIIIAASGGGSRAAMFTALVLDMLTETRPKGSDFALVDCVLMMSSVSGGSLATAYHAEGARSPWRSRRSPPRSAERTSGEFIRILTQVL